MKRKTLSQEFDPLAQIVPQDPTVEMVPMETTATMEPKAPKIPTVRKVRLPVHVPRELAERARNTVYHLSGPPLRMTLSELVTRAIENELDRLEAEHNQGEEFPTREAELKPGRPVR